MLVFDDTFKVCDEINIVFLCGNKYLTSDESDKRNILKNFLIANCINAKPIILEENFIFGKTNKKHLSYDNIFLKGLAQVEELASLFADKIIIIHETISTAAEIGMFAINKSLSKKICLLTPDDIAIGEKKVSAFIKLAFLNSNDSSVRINRNIIYYPDIEVNRLSPEKSDYHTYFHDNVIKDNLASQILDFTSKHSNESKLTFKHNKYKNQNLNTSGIDYYIENDTLHVNISINYLRSLLLSMFYVDSIRKELRTLKKIKDHTTFLCKEFGEILCNTISLIEGFSPNGIDVKITINNTICKYRQAVGYYLYLLQAIGFIGLEYQEENEDLTIRKVRITNELDEYSDRFKGLIVDKRVTSFGKIGV